MEFILKALLGVVIYDCFKSDEKVNEAAAKGWKEKEELADQQRDGSREYHLAEAEFWRVNTIVTEKSEKKSSVTRERYEIAVNWAIRHRHDVDSNAAQIAKHSLELDRTQIFQVGGVQYLTKWDKLRCKGWLLYHLLKAEGCNAAADELWKAIDELKDIIKYESNGKAFNEARTAAKAALHKWKENDDRTDWDAAKPKYDAELEKWNAFKPKGDEYAKALESKIIECITYECISDFATEFFPNELAYARIQKLEDDNKQNIQEINELKKRLEQKDKENCELKKGLDQNSKEINDLKKRLEQKDKENCELKNDSEQYRKDISELKNDSEQHKQDISELKNDSEQHKQDISELKNDSEQHKQDISELKNDSEQHKKDISELKNDSEQYKQDITELKNDSEQYKKDITELKNDSKQYKKDITELKNDSEQYKKDISELKNDSKQYKNDITELKNDSEQYKKDITELKNDSEQHKQDISELKNNAAQKNKICELNNYASQQNQEISELKNDAEQKRRRIRKLEDGIEKKCEEIWGMKGEMKQNGKTMSELMNDLEQKRRRIRRLEDGGEKKCEEIKALKGEIKQNNKEMCELKGTMGKMTECMNSLVQGIHTLLRGQCQYIAESEATARTAVEREWQLWCEHTMAERRTLQESEAAARHQQLYNFDD